MIRRAITTLAVLAIVAVALLNAAHLARTVLPAPLDLPGEPSDPVMRAEQRFAAVHAALTKRGVTGNIGYFSDVPQSELNREPQGVERYFHAQFALAPLILEVDGQDRWIVTDFEHDASRERIPAGWRIVQGFGGGVMLLKRLP